MGADWATDGARCPRWPTSASVPAGSRATRTPSSSRRPWCPTTPSRKRTAVPTSRRTARCGSPGATLRSAIVGGKYVVVQMSYAVLNELRPALSGDRRFHGHAQHRRRGPACARGRGPVARVRPASRTAGVPVSRRAPTGGPDGWSRPRPRASRSTPTRSAAWSSTRRSRPADTDVRMRAQRRRPVGWRVSGARPGRARWHTRTRPRRTTSWQTSRHGDELEDKAEDDRRGGDRATDEQADAEADAVDTTAADPATDPVPADDEDEPRTTTGRKADRRRRCGGPLPQLASWSSGPDRAATMHGHATPARAREALDAPGPVATAGGVLCAPWTSAGRPGILAPCPQSSTCVAARAAGRPPTASWAMTC